jgi:hypothetical protein
MSNTHKLDKAQMKLEEVKRVEVKWKVEQGNGEPSQSQGWTSV